MNVSKVKSSLTGLLQAYRIPGGSDP